MPEKLEDIRHIKSMVDTLRSRRVKLLSQAAMRMVEEENDRHKVLTTFASFLQGDNPLLHPPQPLAAVAGHSATPGQDAAFLEEMRGNVHALVSSSREYLDRLTELCSKTQRIHAQKKALAKKLLL